MKRIALYTDASVQKNKSFYSIVEVIDSHITKYYYHAGSKRNSYKVEKQAVLKAIELYKSIPNRKITIRTDCMSLLNDDYILQRLESNMELKFVKGHKSGKISLKHHFNKIADKLASKYNKGAFYTKKEIILI